MDTFPHKVFGTRQPGTYYDRPGAYLIPYQDGLFGLVKTPKGLFLIGGGYEGEESDEDCIRREALEETGRRVENLARFCSAEAFVMHERAGLFHPMQTYYLGALCDQVTEPAEADHELLFLPYNLIRGQMFSDMQNWAVDQAYAHENKSADPEKAG